MKKRNYSLWVGIIIMTAISAGEVSAEDPAPNETINLWPAQPKIALEDFLPQANATGHRRLICPGGGYEKPVPVMKAARLPTGSTRWHTAFVLN
jgi:hypothetical protein